MIKQIKYILVTFLLTQTLLYAVEQNQLKVTHIANEGFMLEARGKKVLVDALFGKKELGFCDVPTKETLNKISSALPPFINADLILVTHQHVDHFDANLVVEYLEKNEHCNLIGTQQVVDKLKEFENYTKMQVRIRAITPSVDQREKVTINGIEITVLHLKHCTYYVTDEKTGKQINRHRDMQNIGFLVKMGDYKVLHIGDSGMEDEEEYKNFRLNQEQIDIAFLGSLFWPPYESRIDIVNNYINPKNIVVMHLDKGDKEKYFKLKKTYQDRLAPITIFKNLMGNKLFRK